MKLEKAELDSKLNSLNKFLSTLGGENSPLLTDDQVDLLKVQQQVMTEYTNILASRIHYDTHLFDAVGSLEAKHCSDERPCVNCFSDQGICETKMQEFLKEMTGVSYKYGLKFFYPLNSDTLAVTELHEDDLRCGTGYTEVIKGSGFVEF